jgi:molybdate transport system regulatory protein
MSSHIKQVPWLWLVAAGPKLPQPGGSEYLQLRQGTHFQSERNTMKISARNQFQGKIESVKTGAVNSEVDLTLSGGQKVVAIVTNDSVNALNLKAGGEAVALVKASSVLIMTDSSGLRLSARNCLAGTVTALNAGPVNAEVTIELPGGSEVHATITHGAADELGLKEGAAATAVFKASAVILGVPA